MAAPNTAEKREAKEREKTKMTGKALAAAQAANRSVADIRKAAVKTKQQQRERPGREPFLKMGKDGVWAFGAGNTEVDSDALYAIDPRSYKTGYTCWSRFEDIGLKKKDAKLGVVMVPMGSDAVALEELEEHSYDYKEDGKDKTVIWDWSETREITLVCISGEDKGRTMVYNTNSSGGLDVLEEYFNQMLDKMDEGDNIVAIVSLTFSTYDHPRFGKTYKPVFEYHEWRTLDDAAPVEADEKPAEIAKTKKPKKDKKAKKAQKPVTRIDGDGAGYPPASTRRRQRPAA